MSKLRYIRGLLLFLSAVLFPNIGYADKESNLAKDNEIVIGSILTLSGYGAFAAQGEKNAIQLATSDINAAGGILGKPLRVLFEDNQSDLKKTATAFSKLSQVDRVPAILGPNWAEFGLVAAPLANQKQVVMLSASSYTDDMLSIPNGFAFTSCPSHGESVKPLSDFIVNKKYKKIALVNHSNAFISAISDALTDKLKTGELSIWKTYTFNPGEFDFRTTITKLRAESVDAAVMFLLQDGSMPSFLKQRKELGFTGDVLASVTLFDDPVIREDKGLAEGVVFYSYPIETVGDFADRYRKMFGVEPYYTSPWAYDNVFFLKSAIEKCGYSGREIRDCLRKQEYHGISRSVGFNELGYGTLSKDPTKLFRVEGGEIKAVH